MKQTAVEWLAEKYDYVTWMCKRDEIYPEVAEQWKQHYFEQAKEMEKKQIMEAFDYGDSNLFIDKDGEQYYNETFKSE